MKFLGRFADPAPDLAFLEGVDCVVGVVPADENTALGGLEDRADVWVLFAVVAGDEGEVRIHVEVAVRRIGLVVCVRVGVGQ